MEAADHLILFGSLLVAVSILAGMFSSRLGVPLLLVFLGLGMLAGEDGPGGIPFNDFAATYLVGSVALAIILFDGGLHTQRAVFRLALWPALSLATVGVAATAGLVGLSAIAVLGVGSSEGLLLGAVLASTDAAAVFLLLHSRGVEINRRVSATLETESGINDPMAVFLVLILVQLMQRPDLPWSWQILEAFATQMVGGAALGVGGGFALQWLLNRIEIATGLYAVLVAALAIALFAGANALGASGFLAVYLAGVVLGNRPHRAQQIISRFHDGLAWLAQIVMFLLLGLLVTPSALLPDLAGAAAIALVLMVVARPAAVWLSLLPFRLDWREKVFIAWVGLRGAVPIFLASIPILAGMAGGQRYFNIAFVAVLGSLIVQGWTVGLAARWLGLDVPTPPDATDRRDLDLPGSADRELTGYRVIAGCPATRHPFAELNLPKRTRITTVIRAGAVVDRQTLDRLAAGDYVLAMVPPEQLIVLDRLFAPAGPDAPAGLGEFVLRGDSPVAVLADLYGLPVPAGDRDTPLAEFLARQIGPGQSGPWQIGPWQIGQSVVVGDRLSLGNVELVVRELEGERIALVGLELDPAEERLPVLRLWHRLRARLGRLRRR